MLIPLRTNRQPKRRPVVTETLIVVNMLVYLAGLLGEAGGVTDRDAVAALGHLQRGDFHVYQLVTYQFLHDPRSIFHLAFNMLFLWVFGAAVEDRMGRLSFLLFYLMGGAIAGIAHMMISPAPVIGASGAIAGVTGAFLALFPRSRIQILFFVLIGVYSIPALWFIGFYFALDVLFQFGSLVGRGGARVAYMAHIAGYLYGFTLAFLLLATGIVKREEFDVFFLFRQWRRRAAFRAATRGRIGGAWESASADTSRQLSRQNRTAAPLTDEQRAVAEMRSTIGRCLAAHDLPGAAERYRELLRTAPATVLPADQQLDVANQLQVENDARHAAQAYELLLEHHPRHPSAPEVRLILGLLYLKELDRPDRGRELVEAARDKLTDEQQRSLANQLLTET